MNLFYKLPNDIFWTDIMSRVPIAPISRFRSVSKSWNEKICELRFRNLHHNNSTLFDGLIVNRRTGSISLLERYKEMDGSVCGYGILIGSVKGVTAVYRNCILTVKNITLQTSFQIELPHQDHIKKLGLAYNSVSSRFIIVLVVENYMYLYSFSHTNDDATVIRTRKSLPDIISALFDAKRPGEFRKGRMQPQTIVDGCPFWGHTRRPLPWTQISIQIVKFDAVSEDFILLPIFDTPTYRDFHNVCYLEIGGDLCLYIYNSRSSFIVETYCFLEQAVWFKVRTVTLSISSDCILIQNFREETREFVYIKRGRFYICKEGGEEEALEYGGIGFNCGRIEEILACFRFERSLIDGKAMKKTGGRVSVTRRTDSTHLTQSRGPAPTFETGSTSSSPASQQQFNAGQSWAHQFHIEASLHITHSAAQLIYV